MEEAIKQILELLLVSSMSVRAISLDRLPQCTGVKKSIFQKYIHDGVWIEGVIFHKPTKQHSKGDGSRCKVYVDVYAYSLWAIGHSIEQIKDKIRRRNP